MQSSSRASIVFVLGITQTLAWASSYYLPAMLAASMARDFGISTQAVFAGFSAALVLSALIGPWSGHCIDRWGGRPVLIATNIIFAAGIGGLALAPSAFWFFAAWLVIGLGMGSGLYEAAFSALVRWYGTDSRNAITGITLFAGFASTVGWPFSAWLELHYGWRTACLSWAALHLFLGLPLNACLPRAGLCAFTHSGTPTHSPALNAPSTTTETVTEPLQGFGTAASTERSRALHQASILLALVFAITWFISTAMAAHLPGMLQTAGLSLASAVAIGALVGPAQVAGRILEFGLLRHVHPLLSAKLAALAHPAGAALLLLFAGPAAVPFAVLHGSGNGILTIAKGTLPLVIFGPGGYGMRQGLLMVPARMAQAIAPFLFGVLIEHWGFAALWVSAFLGLISFGALVRLGRLDYGSNTA
jgi:predicted MFS family arabinose efflux permease